MNVCILSYTCDTYSMLILILILILILDTVLEFNFELFGIAIDQNVSH